MKKSCGILMHITSLPSPYGIGTLGAEARKFAEFLSDAGQKYWQVLPIGHTGFGDSPYQPFSAFAGNPYFIDLDTLVSQGLLQSAGKAKPVKNADYGKLYRYKYRILKKIDFSRLPVDKYNEFLAENDFWLDGYSLFMALKEHFKGASFDVWEEGIRQKKPESIAAYKKKLSKQIGFWKGIQYIFFEQWREFKTYANSLGVNILGDIPIYCAFDSADVWNNPEIFLLDKNLKQNFGAGCPPDQFSDIGQLWGNPLYDWKKLKKTGYEWWVRRVEYALTFFDVLRIDHFRGFESFFAIPSGAKTAAAGHWEKGPGIALFKTIKSRLPNAEIVAEDLGFLTEGVYTLLKKTGFPGMKVLQFSLGGADNPYLPSNYKNSNCVVYTGTHDNDTTRGWISHLNDYERQRLKELLKKYKSRVQTYKVVEWAFDSKAKIAVVPLQDYLNLPSSHRMNTPSVLGGNWNWRVPSKLLTKKLSDDIRSLAEKYKRC